MGIAWRSIWCVRADYNADTNQFVNGGDVALDCQGAFITTAEFQSAADEVAVEARFSRIRLIIKCGALD